MAARKVNSSDGQPPADLELATSTAAKILAAFDDYNAQFSAITRRARRRFMDREWKLGQRDAVERIELYDQRVERCIAELVGFMGARVADPVIWAEIKGQYARQISDCSDPEFYKTFFNSLTRKAFGTVGVNSALEFIALDLEPALGAGDPPLTVFETSQGFRPVADGIIRQFQAQLGGMDNAEQAVRKIQVALEELARAHSEHETIHHIELLEAVFYRATRAFLVGRVQGSGWSEPLLLTFRNDDEGLDLDAVITSSNEVRMLFGFHRSYFHVDLPEVGAAVRYLQSVMPGKSTGELFTVLGRAKQGKTERYRSVFKHLEACPDQFVHAQGETGMVMIVFTLPSLDIVLKVIRDRFAEPKTTTRQEVMAKYRFVFKHDRVGRLVDAQEFRRLRIPRERFAPALLEELESASGRTCRADGDDLIIEHCYIERRVRPLNLYLQEADELSVRRAVADYGQAIRDLALSNVFPGDLLAKNFGVTRHGRVIFYDYDELCMVTDCRFREMPRARYEEDETRDEPWFYVGPDDVFPEQFIDFLGLPAELRREFMKHHAELMQAEYWRKIKICHEAEQLLEVVPYGNGHQLTPQHTSVPA